MPESTLPRNSEETSRLMNVTEQALAKYRAHPTTDNLAACFLSYFEMAATRIAHLTDRLTAAEAEIRVLKTAAVSKPERPRLRPNSLPIPTAPQAGG